MERAGWLNILKEFVRVVLIGAAVAGAYYLVAETRLLTLSDDVRDTVLKGLILVAAFLVAMAITKVLRLSFWESYRAKKNLPRVPSMARQAVSALIYLGTLFFVLQAVFHLSIAGLLTATGALGVVVGLALRELISDVFSGMIMGLDKTIKIGDWVRIEGRTFEPKVGFVAQMNWRTVHIHTPENVLVVVPNTFLTNNVITNLTQPSEKKEFELTFTFDFDVASERVIRVLNSALYQTKEILQDPEPKTRLSRVTTSGVEYKVKYWLVPSEFGPGKTRNFVIDHVLTGLRQAGLSLSYPKTDVYHAELPVRNLDTRSDRVALLRKVDLWGVLSLEQVSTLAAGLQERTVRRDEVVVRAGDTGDSMFVLVEGFLNVVLVDPVNETEVKVAQLKPGSSFGEMSLLTGEPRSASIVAVGDSFLYEIPRESLEPVLVASPQLAEALSQKVVEIRLQNASALEQQHSAGGEDRKRSLTRDILAKIRSFFHLG